MLTVPASNQAIPGKSFPAATSPYRTVRPQTDYRLLRDTEIKQLERQGCSAEDWGTVRFSPDCDLTRFRSVTFLGDIWLGSNRGVRELPNGIRCATGVSNTILQDCTVGHEVVIRNVRQAISRYDIGDQAVISDISSLTMVGESRFGNGQEVHALREDGKLPVVIYDFLSSNIVALLTSSRLDGTVRTQIQEITRKYVDGILSDRGYVGQHAMILNCGELMAVRLGPGASVNGVTQLRNVSLNSCLESPVHIGAGTIIVDSIIGAASHISGNSTIARCFVGQGVRMGKQFSAVDSLFFANAEAYHGEACSLVAGPHTVTHHKSTLLISAQTSFFNAGAGTKQCNHAYKTGPAHYGILERGCKTGGSSCVAWPANVGPFSTILGNHRCGFDTRDFPFSFIVEKNGQTRLIPGLNLARVGLFQDTRKWPARERRAESGRLDLMHYEVLSPYTVQRMLRGRQLLDRLRASAAENDTEWVEFAGTQIRRADVHRGWNLYNHAIGCYLSEQIVERLEARLRENSSWSQAFSSKPSNIDFEGWFDTGGSFTSGRQLKRLSADLIAGRTQTVQGLQAALVDNWNSYHQERWQWCWQVWLREAGKQDADISLPDLLNVVEQWHADSTFLTQAARQDGEDDLALAQMWDADRRTLSRLTGEPSASGSTPAILAAIDEHLAAIDYRATQLKQALLACERAVEDPQSE